MIVMLRLVASLITKGINLFFQALKNKLTGKGKTTDEDLDKLSNLNDSPEIPVVFNHDKHVEILKKLKHFMEEKKVYKDPDLTIKDLATMVGTNRSYISSTINYFNKTNFPTFLNKYRCLDFQEQFRENPEETCSNLSKRAGFGSVDSMKRTIYLVTGMHFREWRAKTLAEIKKQTTHHPPENC
jgi:AraC-like DNA-binding protein